MQWTVFVKSKGEKLVTGIDVKRVEIILVM